MSGNQSYGPSREKLWYPFCKDDMKRGPTYKVIIGLVEDMYYRNPNGPIKTCRVFESFI